MSNLQSKVTFIVEASDDNSSEAFISSVDRLVDGINKTGHILALARRTGNQVDLLPGYSVDPCSPTVAWGSIQFIKNLKIPHIAYGWDSTHFKKIASIAPRRYLLNSTFSMTTVGDLKQDFNFWQNLYSGGTDDLSIPARLYHVPLFIRPESNTKEFAGQVFKSAAEFKDLMDLLHIPLDTICVVDQVRDIYLEIRCFIAAGKVELAVEYYRKPEFPAHEHFDRVVGFANAYANMMSSEMQAENSCFVMDMAITSGNNLKIVEFNSFCCSGFYDADVSSLVEAIARQAYQDYS